MTKNNNDYSMGSFLKKDISDLTDNINKGITENKSSICSTGIPEYHSRIGEMIEIQSEMIEEKERKEAERERREKENNQYLKSLSENVDLIANEFSNVMTNLIILNSLIEKSENSLQQIENQIDTSNKIQAEIFEELVKSNFKNEEERIKAANNLVTKFSGKVELSSNLLQIIQAFSQFM
ncbi:hypothetical protein [Staphylococcus equorum]|uniref:hypothetical protein n=1 Tax=Staphylococcus equorum TaxID=246432 RepID=UPI000D1C36DB|nr:hypothetical protein [Staphylococcus equorum]PTE43383.1 hypothetical protein BUY77_05660 [Staphylococcus equorum]RIL48130.1 hypothetical protein BUY82_06265 [Staphylococcus equorum]